MGCASQCPDHPVLIPERPTSTILLQGIVPGLWDVSTDNFMSEGAVSPEVASPGAGMLAPSASRCSVARSHRKGVQALAVSMLPSAAPSRNSAAYTSSG